VLNFKGIDGTLNSTKSMGPALAIGVAVSLLSMMTLLPALLVITARWVFWPAKAEYGSDEPTTRGLWALTGPAAAGSRLRDYPGRHPALPR
jgi:putative drug exporter of the RND superfamily